MSTQFQRQARIRRLIEGEPVTSQRQLVELLEVDGVTTTQATCSRDLRDLGVTKERRNGAVVYVVPVEHERTRLAAQLFALAARLAELAAQQSP